MEMGLKRAFRLSGNSVRPAYPGFMVIKAAQVGTKRISRPSNMNLDNYNKRRYFLPLKFDDITRIHLFYS